MIPKLKITSYKNSVNIFDENAKDYAALIYTENNGKSFMAYTYFNTIVTYHSTVEEAIKAAKKRIISKYC